jgi:hypothetical protein
MQNHEGKKKKVKKVKNQDSMGITNFFLAPCPSRVMYGKLLSDGGNWS